jgi:hypothetical protein
MYVAKATNSVLLANGDKRVVQKAPGFSPGLLKSNLLPLCIAQVNDIKYLHSTL